MVMAHGGECVLPAGGEIDRIALPVEPLGNCLSQLAFVFNQQNVESSDPKTLLKMYKLAAGTMLSPQNVRQT